VAELHAPPPESAVDVARTNVTDSRRLLVQQLRNRPFARRWLKLVQELWYGHSWLSRVLERQLRELRPDVVYALLGNYALTRLTCRTCEKLGIPLFLHVTDDFVTAMYQHAPFSHRLQSASLKWFGRAVKHAGCCAAVSPAMAEEYERRFGQAWTWYTTLVDKDDYDPSPPVPSTTVRLVYAGNLGLNRWKVLRGLGTALASLGSGEGMDIRLWIYSSPEQLHVHGAALEIPGVTELKGWLDHKDLPGVFHTSDILVHVESDDSTTVALTRFSFSTKLSQYMMASRCVLAIGPRHLASMQVVREAEAGLIVEDLTCEASQRALRAILRDEHLRSHCGANGRGWAIQWTDAGHRRAQFRADLLRCTK
jgi:glycosyltransferase involved in cell wall biosynthesis